MSARTVDWSFRLLVVLSAGLIGFATTPMVWLGAAGSVTVATLLLSRDVRAVSLDYALLLAVVAAAHRWQFADRPPLEAATAAFAALAVVIALTGGQRHSIRATGVALAAAIVMLSTLVEPETLRWVGVAGCLIAGFASHPHDNDAPGAMAVTALAVDLTSLVLSMTLIGSMAIVDDLGSIVLVPFVVSLCSVVALIARWGRFSELLSAEMLRDTVPEAVLPMIEMTANGTVLRASEAAEPLGLVSGTNLLGLVDDASREALQEAMSHPVVLADPFEVEIRLVTDHDGWRDIELGIRYLGRVATTWVMSVRDRTEDRLAQQQQVVELDRLRSAVTTDRLTGVLNRGGIFGALESRLRTSGATVLFLDLDGFKAVNDSYGHESGDAVLIAVAQRLEQGVGPDWEVGRLGGDEFLVLGPDVPMKPDDLDRLADLVRTPVSFNGRSLVVDTSIGMAVGQAGADPDELLRTADAAMYRHKDGRRSSRSRPRDVSESGPPSPAPAGSAEPAAPAEPPVVERRRLSSLFSR